MTNSSIYQSNGESLSSNESNRKLRSYVIFWEDFRRVLFLSQRNFLSTQSLSDKRILLHTFFLKIVFFQYAHLSPIHGLTRITRKYRVRVSPLGQSRSGSLYFSLSLPIHDCHVLCPANRVFTIILSKLLAMKSRLFIMRKVSNSSLHQPRFKFEYPHSLSPPISRSPRTLISLLLRCMDPTRIQLSLNRTSPLVDSLLIATMGMRCSRKLDSAQSIRLP
jgi:hypothetical protein